MNHPTHTPVGELSGRISAHEKPHHEPASVAFYLIIFGILMALLVVTVAVSYFDMGILNIVIAMAIAVVKAVLVILFFMHVLHGTRLTWIFSSAAFLWLAIMIGFTVMDYYARGPYAFATSVPRSVSTPSSMDAQSHAELEHRGGTRAVPGVQ